MRVTTKGARTRLRLLDAAAAELVAHGGDMALGAVARRARVSPGAPYRHFRSKADLVAELVDDFYQRFDRAVFKPMLLEHGDWRARELERTRRFVRFLYADPVGPVFIAQLAGDKQVIRSQWRGIEGAIAAAAANIRRGQASGEIPRALDAELAGAAVIGGLLRGVGAAMTRKPRMAERRVAAAMCRFIEAALELRAPRARPRSRR